MEYVLQTKGLTKRFGNKAAVNNVNLNVKKGDIYGFIGKNGAGKTTLIRLVSGLARPNEGSIKLFESENLDNERRKTGTMIENPAVFPGLTAKQNLHYYCRLLGLDPSTTIDEMLRLVGLEDTGRKKAKNFSLGMKQRLAIAIALLDDPEFLMLDEPINGLDPTGIKEIRELVLKLNKEKSITILISSHILGELSKIATRYGIINNGVMVDEFTKEELLHRCVGELEVKVDLVNKAIEILSKLSQVPNYRVIDDNTIRFVNEPDKAGMINTELAKNGITIMSSSVVGQDLEDYFMQLMENK
ncbi:ATP-binding cassette domain-containing protein [Mobilitalea sibirica]|uniref:ATP-binding cassette domain-containing protein n=1 Tax=Mobilitalea sibirica TaxID=1462919 RepID=A0A8J7KWM6_9FIRM|nr:ATP-binding cassette domain-containing protein [Mobilitalea sibirica]MBH1940662.1 ATP-binding cassette domain-containing protein [Mobilitalea sibirica]